MPIGIVIRKNQYYDSVFLMRVNKRLSVEKGVTNTAMLMGSDANKLLLADIGLRDPRLDAALPNDLVVAVIGETQEIVDTVLGKLDQFLEAVDEGRVAANAKTLEEGLAQKPQANLAVISVPGEYAAREARKALETGLNVFLFSDNVSLEDELMLKTLATHKGLLVMGPDCGTSIIGGKGIGFANAVRRGAIGVVGPSGTGIQEFTSQVHNYGYGISHAIGTGSHDLSDEIGGLTTLAGIAALEADDQTKVIAVVSKPPGKKTLETLTARFRTLHKPVIACFLGVNYSQDQLASLPYEPAATLDAAVQAAIFKAHGKQVGADPENWSDLLKKERRGKSAEQKYLRGIFAGGTFCYQSQQILQQAGMTFYSNAPLDKKFLLAHPNQSVGNSLVDMGDDYYTRGKPHPMIDSTMRRLRILEESLDPSVSVLLLDFILGYNAALDPVGDLTDAVTEARKNARKAGRELSVVASICGTDGDPQNLHLQAGMLAECGVIILPSNAQAASFCVRLITGKE